MKIEALEFQYVVLHTEGEKTQAKYMVNKEQEKEAHLKRSNSNNPKEQDLAFRIIVFQI